MRSEELWCCFAAYLKNMLLLFCHCVVGGLAPAASSLLPVRATPHVVIANQCAHWCGNLLRSAITTGNGLDRSADMELLPVFGVSAPPQGELSARERSE